MPLGTVPCSLPVWRREDLFAGTENMENMENMGSVRTWHRERGIGSETTSENGARGACSEVIFAEFGLRENTDDGCVHQKSEFVFSICVAVVGIIVFVCFRAIVQ